MLSKMSFAMTLLRLVDGKTRMFVWFVIVSSTLLASLSMLFLWVQCNPVAKNWQPMLPGTCWNPNVNVIIGIAGGVYSTLGDWVLALLPWKVIWKLQMQRKEKIGVGIAMSMGILFVRPLAGGWRLWLTLISAGVTSLIKVSKIPVLAGGDFTCRFAPPKIPVVVVADFSPAVEGTYLILWSAAEASATIMAASIPVLRVLFRRIKATTQQRYGGTGDVTTHRRGTRTNTVVVTAHSRRDTRTGAHAPGTKADDSSSGAWPVRHG